MGEDTIRIDLPGDPRYLDAAVAAVEALAGPAGLDKDDLSDLRSRVRAALSDRLARQRPGRFVLSYDVGDGFLGMRVVDGFESPLGTLDPEEEERRDADGGASSGVTS